MCVEAGFSQIQSQLFIAKMGICVCRMLYKKITKGQIHDGSISQNTFHEVYKPCAKCHAFIKKCTITWYAALLMQSAHKM